MLTSIDLDIAPIERVRQVIPNTGFVGEEEDIVEADATSCSFMIARLLHT
jgi:hypothetical protein